MQQRGFFFYPLPDRHQALLHLAGDGRDDLGVAQMLTRQVHQSLEAIDICFTRMHLSFNRIKASLGNVELAGRNHPFTVQLLDTLKA